MATSFTSPDSRHGQDHVSDGCLLDHFIRHNDESAFAEIVQRHARMVLGVCQRVLGNAHDAEDCFQAVFLVLVRKATTIQPRDMVGNWLYGVAYRTALEARKMAARRRLRETSAECRKSAECRVLSAEKFTQDSGLSTQDSLAMLDQEMMRLPDKYRFVLVACDIEGRARKEVAKAISAPEGTVASRLARARAMLAKRLQRRHLAISAGAIGALLVSDASAAKVPPTLVSRTIEAAARLVAGKSVDDLVNNNVSSLIQSAIRAMLVAKLKIASAVLVVLAILGVSINSLLPVANAPFIENTAKAADDGKRAKPVWIKNGIVQAIDQDGKRIIVTGNHCSGDEATAIYDVQVEPDTTIVIDGKSATFNDIVEGASINLKMVRNGPNAATAVRIEMGQLPIQGVVQAFTNDSVTIETVNRATGATELKKCELAPGALCKVENKKSKLKVKMQVALNVSVEKPVVFAIKATGPKLEGEIRSVQVGQRRVSLTVGSVSRIVTLTDDAVILIDGRARTLADLQVGMVATVRLADVSDESNAIGITVK